MIYQHTSVFVVVGSEEGPFSAPKALEAPMGELGPEPGALLVGVESVKHKVFRHSLCLHPTYNTYAEAWRTNPYNIMIMLNYNVFLHKSTLTNHNVLYVA